MIFAAGILVAAGMLDDVTAGRRHRRQMVAYVVGFILLFILSGHRQRLDLQDDPVDLRGEGAASAHLGRSSRTPGRSMSGALIGFAGAVGALGGVFINIVLRASYAAPKSATNAFWVFLGFYVCVRGHLGRLPAQPGDGARRGGTIHRAPPNADPHPDDASGARPSSSSATAWSVTDSSRRCARATATAPGG